MTFATALRRTSIPRRTNTAPCATISQLSVRGGAALRRHARGSSTAQPSAYVQQCRTKPCRTLLNQREEDVEVHTVGAAGPAQPGSGGTLQAGRCGRLALPDGDSLPRRGGADGEARAGRPPGGSPPGRDARATRRASVARCLGRPGAAWRPRMRPASRPTPPAASPPEVWTCAPDGGGARRLTDHAAPLLAGLALGRPRSCTLPAPDGLAVESWLELPPGATAAAGPCPTLLELHGGPHGAVGPAFATRTQLLAGRSTGTTAGIPASARSTTASTRR